MGAILGIPFFGWIVSPIVSACLAFPFYILWHWCDIKEFFPFLPANYQNIGFWQLVGLFLVVSMAKSIALPKVSVSNSCKGD